MKLSSASQRTNRLPHLQTIKNRKRIDVARGTFSIMLTPILRQPSISSLHRNQLPEIPQGFSRPRKPFVDLLHRMYKLKIVFAEIGQMKIATNVNFPTPWGGGAQLLHQRWVRHLRLPQGLSITLDTKCTLRILPFIKCEIATKIGHPRSGRGYRKRLSGRILSFLRALHEGENKLYRIMTQKKTGFR